MMSLGEGVWRWQKKDKDSGKTMRSWVEWKVEGLREMLITVDFVLKIMGSHCCPSLAWRRSRDIQGDKLGGFSRKDGGLDKEKSRT